MVSTSQMHNGNRWTPSKSWNGLIGRAKQYIYSPRRSAAFLGGAGDGVKVFHNFVCDFFCCLGNTFGFFLFCCLANHSGFFLFCCVGNTKWSISFLLPGPQFPTSRDLKNQPKIGVISPSFPYSFHALSMLFFLLCGQHWSSKSLLYNNLQNHLTYIAHI